MKTKGQQPRVDNLELLAPYDSADVGKWLNPVPLKGNSCLGFVGSNPTVGSNIKPQLRLHPLPGLVITTAEAAMTCKPIIGFPAVDLKEIHSDVPLLQSRMSEIRKAR